MVCIPDASGTVVGYNLIVGGGMGRTHRKESTFARVGDHLGYVAADKLYEALKAIVATQRDHGNRSVRANARMKYLVDKVGIDAFRSMVETYFGESFEPYRELKPWKYEDWLGWHEQGDGNLFLGLFVENGRIKDEGDFKLRSALRRIIDAYEFDMVVSPNQNIILKNITPEQKGGIEAILKEHSVKLATEYDTNKRLSMACPAMPLCGLAVTEAERVMPDTVDRMNTLFAKHGVTVPITMRMTGCPNGCARPYMAELGFVGSGPSAYQIWLGGCPNQTRLAWPYLDRVKDALLEETLSPILDMYVSRKKTDEAFGDFCNRMGKEEIERYVESRKPVMEAAGVNGAVVNAPAKAAATPVASSNTSTIDFAPGAPKITVVSAGDGEVTGGTTNAKPRPAPVVKAEPVVNEGSSMDSASATKRKAGKPRPRLTVGDDVMERLKNIAALRDMSASMVADEIISAYLSGVDDEDLMKDT